MHLLDFSLIAFAASVVFGLLGSLLGLGGGVFVVPMLTLGLGLDIHDAIGASIVTVIATSSGAAATYVRDRLTNIRIGMFLEMATTTGAITGAFLGGVVPARYLYIVFALLMGWSALNSMQQTRGDLPDPGRAGPLVRRLRLAGSYYDAALDRQVEYAATGVPQGFGMMYVAGLISGLLGIGSGALKVLAMDGLMRLPLKVSSATSNFMIGVTAAASAAIYFARGDIRPETTAPVALGVLLGASLGSLLLTRIGNRTLRLVAIPVLLFIGVEMLLRGLGV
ncbi:MAG: sulfite exporter TauE/SafE family protein [Bacillota bacterium]|nr:sulfite exporter TauE/SafE family protein [Bacillota bacterium]